MCGTTGAAMRYFGTWLNELRFAGLLPVFDHPFSHNIILPRDVLNDTCRDFYSMGETETREALVIRREAVENLYFI